jgi:ribonuclease P protein component
VKEDSIRLLIVVTKKISKKAVTRNKIKRRFKEAFKQNVHLTKAGYDYQMIVRSNLAEAEFKKIIEDIEKCLKRVE